jgi:hypothetical protein
MWWNWKKRKEHANIQRDGSCQMDELADHLAKEAAYRSEADIAYIKIPKSAGISELKEKGVQVLLREWDASTKAELTKTFFPTVKD